MSESDSTTLPLKTCRTCGDTLPATSAFFCHRKDAKDGLNATCKRCRNAGFVKWAAEHREYWKRWRSVPENHAKVIEVGRKWQASHRQETRDYARQYYSEHKAERAEYARSRPEAKHKREKAWRVANPEKKAAAARRRRGIRIGAEGSHTATDVLAQYDRQGGKCFYCGKKVGKKYHADHVMPLALGGSNGPENLVISCPKCNCAKRDRHPMDFAGILL